MQNICEIFGQKFNNSLCKRIYFFGGDITTLPLDTIVNAANQWLKPGGGVCGAIHRKAGRELAEYCDKLNKICPTGEAVLTPGFNLPAKHVIHAVGPQGRNDEKLRSCYNFCLDLCQKNNLKSIAFPCISTGIYGFPKKAAAEVAFSTVVEYLKTNDDIEKVVFCLFLNADRKHYEELVPKLLLEEE